MVPPEQSPKMTSFRGGTPDGSGELMISPEGSVYGLGGGREVSVESNESGCLTGGSRAARASALDLRRGINLPVSSGFRGIGSCNIYPMAGTVISQRWFNRTRDGRLASMFYRSCLD